MAARANSDDLRSLAVTGMMDGRPTRVDWGAGVLEGRPDDVLSVRNYALAHEGEWFPIHPEGGAAPAGLDTYESAWVTVQRAFDSVDDIEGPDPFAGMPDEEEEPPAVPDRSFAERRWTPGLHPRWPKGTPGKGGKFMTKGEIAAARRAGGPTPTPSPGPSPSRRGPSRPRGAGPTRFKGIPTPQDPNSAGTVETSDVKEAARLLGEGRAVRLQSTRQVSVLLEELAAIVADAKAKGEQAPNYDLCKVTVKDTNLFCIESKGIPRIQMPQLKGVPLEGSKAHTEALDPTISDLTLDEKGEVDLTPRFLDYLKRSGFKTSDGEEQAAYLKASQNELNGAKVSGMLAWMRGGGDPHKGGRMLVTEDNYIVDGHHRWAAQVGIDAEDGVLGNDTTKIPVTKIDMDIIELLREAVQYAEREGIPTAGVGQVNPKNA